MNSFLRRGHGPSRMLGSPRELGILLLVVVSAGANAGASATVPLPFWKSGTLAVRTVDETLAGRAGAPTSAEGEAELRRRVQLLLFPPADLGVDRLLPAEGTVDSLFVAAPDLVIRLRLPADFLATGVTDELLERLSRQLVLGLDPWPELLRLHLAVVDPDNPSARRRTLASYLPAVDPALRQKSADEGEASPASLVRRVDSVVPGALDGKLLFVSQAHGYLDYDNANAWTTQRGITHGIVEDFVNAEAVNEYLLRYLHNAGARVFTLRESDRSPAMVIVDEADGSTRPDNGTYVESGAAGAFSSSGLRGFRNFQAPYGPTTDPFTNGGTDRLIATAATETARATWTPSIPAEGDYDVSVAYTRDGTSRASDAHYVVRHTGGVTHLRVNQERHGWVWVFLGRFHFAAGLHPESGSVALANDSSEPGETVSADAVRFGGGMGDVLGEHHATLSGRPRWEEGARTFTQFMGAANAVYAGGDVSARSKFAAWEHVDGVEDSAYLSWHSNAFDGTVRGTSSYIYSNNPPDNTYDPTQSVPGSAALMNRIHDEILNDLRAGWNASWQNRGYRSAYFGEINPSYNPEMPSALLEVAFHDNASDAAALKSPRFRQIVARAIYQGIAKYFAQRDGLPVHLLPEPPREVEAHTTAAGEAVVSWVAPLTDAGGLYGDAATGYRLYRSRDGRGFDDGASVSGTSVTLTGLTPGETVYLRLTAVNAGGESLPSETLVVRPPTATEPHVLLVHGFDRLDSAMLLRQAEPGLGGTVERMDLARMNRFDYLVEHAEALRDLAVAIDSASNEAIGSGRVTLDPQSQAAVFWELGEESTVDETFSTAEQTRVRSYLEAGGRLMVSGAEIAWDLDLLGSAADQSFYREVLRSRYVADDGETYRVDGSPGGLFDGLAGLAFDDGTHGTYDVDYPDVIQGEGSAAVCLDYGGGGLGAAVVAETGSSRVVNLGFPFETIYPAESRRAVLERIAAYFGLARLPAIFSDGFESGGPGRWSATASKVTPRRRSGSTLRRAFGH